MKAWTEKGRDEISCWILSNHTAGLHLYNDDYFINEYLNYIDSRGWIHIDEQHGKCGWRYNLYIEDEWIENYTVNTSSLSKNAQIGINDQINPDLLKKKLCDW